MMEMAAVVTMVERSGTGQSAESHASEQTKSDEWDSKQVESAGHQEQAGCLTHSEHEWRVKQRS